MKIKIKESFIQDTLIKIDRSIKSFRKLKGYSQDELDGIMNLNLTSISKIENGKINLSLDYLSKFSWILDFEFQMKENKNNKSETQI